MRVLIDNRSGEPIYTQIYTQIRRQILSGELEEGTPLPSIRGLARDLRISFLTTKRAYDALEQDGFLYTVQGKGSFVAPRNPELLREETLRRIEEHMGEIVRLAAEGNVSREEIGEMLRLSMEEMP